MVSFPNVTSYIQPANRTVDWNVYDAGSRMLFPNLATITGSASPNYYFNLRADLGGALMSLPALTSITKPADGDTGRNSGIGIAVNRGATISAPLLTSFNDNDPYPSSELNGYGTGILDFPLLTALTGVDADLNEESHPERLVSLSPGSSLQITSGTHNLNKLVSFAGLRSFTVRTGAVVTVPNVTSYTQPANRTVDWNVYDAGSRMLFPNLATITGSASPNYYFNLRADLGDAVMSFPALTSITKPADGDTGRNSGIGIAVNRGATISAPLLSTFSDNDPSPSSELNGYGTGILDFPLLTALTGVDADLNQESHPERLVSLSPGSSLQITSGTHTLNNLVSFAGLRSFTVRTGAVVTVPNVTSYTQPVNRNVDWNVYDAGSRMLFPNLATITGSASPNYYFNLRADLGDAVMSFPALTSINKPADGDTGRNSGIGIAVNRGATISAPLLTSFRDNDSNPDSSISVAGGGQAQMKGLVDVLGVAMDFGSAFTIPEGQNFVGSGTIQSGVFNSGLVGITTPDKTLQINGPLVSTGTVKITNGGTLAIIGSLSLNDAALLVLSSSSRLTITGDLAGTTKNTGGVDPSGTLLMNGGRSALNPQNLEVMSRDLGTASEGFTGNQVFGTLALGNNTNVKLVDNARNTTSTIAECVYANSVVIPAGCTLNLNGLHLYARAVQLGGTVTNGSIIQIPDSGEIALGNPVPGKLVGAGELDEWSFTSSAGRAVSITLNPGPSGAPAPVSPQLGWGNVQLVNSGGDVVASSFSTVQGEKVILADISIPASGSYRIRVNAPASHTSVTGNYVLGVWDSTPDVRPLTLGQKFVGTITGSFAVDHWTFSALEGQQIQLRPQLPVPPGIVFTLKGPAGYVGFQDLTGESALINLPTSGSYTLHVRGLEGAGGAYGFAVNQTSQTPLALNTPYPGTWGGSGDARLFRVDLSQNTPLDILLANIAGGGHSEIYARQGTPPTRESYDHAAKSAGSTQRILIPSAKAGVWYLLAYCESAPGGSKSFELEAKAGEVFLTQNSTRQSVANLETTLVLTGAGFSPGSAVRVVAADGTYYVATSSTTDLPTRITATFAANTLPPGSYSIEVVQPSGMVAQLPSSLTINPAGNGILKTAITVPNPIGNHISATLYVHYRNEGNAPMPAPILNVYGTTVSGEKGAFLSLDASLITAGFWTSATPLGYSDSVQILASGETPGVLQPGESRTVPVYYAGWRSDQWGGGRYDFHVNPTHADSTTPVDYSLFEAATKPAAVPFDAWHIVYANLLSQLGNTAGGYVRLLNQNASYLGQLGRNETDISKLWSFAVTQAYNTLPNESIGGTTDQALPMPGKLSLSFGRTFRNSIPGRFMEGPLGLGWITPWQRRLAVAADGRVTISTGGGDQAVYLPDSRSQGRYFSVPGDHAKLVTVPGGYRHTTLEGVQTVFQSNGRLNYLQDPAGNRITATFTGDKLTKLTASSGPSLDLAYNAAGRISQLTSSAGETTIYTYDAANRHLISVTGTDGRVTTYSYQATAGSAALNALTSIAPPGGTVMNLTYDAKGRLASVSANGGQIPQTLSYDIGCVSITDAAAATTKLFFDQEGMLGKMVDATGNPSFLSYDSTRQLTGITNASGITSSLVRNKSGRVTSVTDFLGTVTRMDYESSFGQLAKLTDAKGNVTSYSYNAAGLLTGTAFANGRTELITYDVTGKPLGFVNAAGEPVNLTHNAAGQLTGATFSSGEVFTYSYNTRGQLLTATNGEGTTSFDYDALTQDLSKVTYPGNLWLAFTYDNAGRRATMTDQSGFITAYEYDTLGRLWKLRDGDGNLIVTHLYAANGRLERKTHGNGTYTTFEYDGNGQVLHLVNRAPDGAVNSRFDATYNALGLKATETSLEGKWTYTYDANGQLVHAVFASNNIATTPHQDLKYAYDAMGNRTVTVINGITTDYVSNNMNQYASVGGIPCHYDGNGNLLSDGTSNFTYNVMNQLESSSGPEGSANYAYNALGKRISKTSGGNTIRELIDPAGLGDLVGTFESNGSVVARYVHGLGLTSQRSGGATRYYDTDVLGSVVGMSNAAGNYVNHYSYLPFGEKLTGVVAVQNPFEFVGTAGVMAETNGLSFMRARFYSAGLGSFLSQDPIGLRGGDFNLYRHVENGPTNYLDPSGLYSTKQALIGLAGLSQLGAIYLRFVPLPQAQLAAALLQGSAVALGIASQFVPSDDGSTSGGGGSGGGGSGGGGSGGGGSGGGGSEYGPPYPLPPDGGGDGGTGGSTGGANADDPNALYGPSGYGMENFVTNLEGTFAYRITYENFADATAPAQIVTVTNKLSADFDWSSFQLTGIGFADNNIVIPAGSQHFQTTLEMTYNGQTFEVQMEAGIHSATGQVYANFYSIDPGTGLPPANVLTGFLPPEDGTGRGMGYLTYTVAPKRNLSTGTSIINVASIVFDANAPVTTDQKDPHDPSQGIDPAKQAKVTIDADRPTSQMENLPAFVPPTFTVNWSGSDGTGSGIASYTVYASTDEGATWSTWLADTTLVSKEYPGALGASYRFHVQAKDRVGNVQIVDPATAFVSTQVPTSSLVEVKDAGGILLPAGTGSVDFGSGATVSRTFTILNVGTRPLGSLATSVTGTHAADFQAGVPVNPTLSGGSSTTFTVQFTPSATGARSAILHVTSDDALIPSYDIELNGTGLPPGPQPDIGIEAPKGTAVATGGTVNFGPLVLKKKKDGSYAPKKKSLTFVVRNSGEANLSGISAGLTGADAAHFKVTAKFTAPLKAGKTKTFKVEFAPKSLGTKTVQLRIVSNDPDESPYLINLVGSASEFGAAAASSSLAIDASAGAGAVVIDPELDSDGDKLPDLLELAVGSDPAVPSPSPLRVELTDGNLVARFSRDKAARLGGTTLCIEWSPDLLVWRSDQIVEVIESDDKGAESIRAEVPLHGAPQIFVRLKAAAKP